MSVVFCVDTDRMDGFFLPSITIPNQVLFYIKKIFYFLLLIVFINSFALKIWSAANISNDARCNRIWHNIQTKDTISSLPLSLS